MPAQEPAQGAGVAVSSQRYIGRVTDHAVEPDHTLQALEQGSTGHEGITQGRESGMGGMF